MLFVTSGRAFTPNKIASCVSWLRSDRGLDSGQANNTTAPNWRSLVSGGADCGQTTDSKRPVWHASGGLNGRPYLTFNGSKGYTWALDLSGAKTVFAVYKLASTPGSGFSLYSIKKSATSNFSEMFVDLVAGGYTKTTFRHDFQAAGTGVGYNPTLGTTNGHYETITYDGGTSTSTSSYTGVLDGSSQTVSASSTISRTGTDLGSLGARLNSSQTVANGLNGDFYEIAVWSRVLTAAEKVHLQNYAKNRYNL